MAGDQLEQAAIEHGAGGPLGKTFGRGRVYFFYRLGPPGGLQDETGKIGPGVLLNAPEVDG